MGRTSSIVKDRYNAKAYDEIKVRVDKGHKVEIQAHAAALGESLNGFIGRAIDEAMERDGSGNPAKAHGVVQDSVGVSLVPDTLEIDETENQRDVQHAALNHGEVAHLD